MKPVRIGIVGMGWIGLVHAQALVRGCAPDAVLTAISSHSADCLPRCRETLGADYPFYEDYEEMFSAGVIDAAVIATPHRLHPEQAVAALRRGLHVLIEKPAGIEPDSVQTMNRAAAESGKVFAIMFNLRTDPLWQTVRQMVQGGELGRIKRIAWTITDCYRANPYYASSGWRATWKGEGGGVLINQGVHYLDLWQWIFGMPAQVQAFCGFGKYHPIETEDDVTAYLAYADGATGTLVLSTGESSGVNRLEVVGECGRLVCEDGQLRLHKTARPEPEERLRNTKPYDAPVAGTIASDVPVTGETSGREGILRNFAAAITHGEPLIAPGEEGLCSLSLSCAMLQSTWENQMITLSNDLSRYSDLLVQRQK